MTNDKILYIVIAVLVLAVIGGGLFFFSGNKGGQKETASPSTAAQTPTTGAPTSTTDKEMVVCTEASDPSCFFGRMNGCLPVTGKMTGSDGKTTIEVTVLGVENEKCHFQRKINNVIDLNCYFPKGTMNWDTIDQTFGNDKGLQKVVDDNCKSGW